MKKYKIFNDHIELYFDLYSDLALNKVVELLNIMELNFSNLICNCLYDQDIIDVNLIDDNIIVTVLQKKKKFIRLIKCKEIEIEVNTIETLKKLFEISNYFDATLTFKSTNGINKSVFSQLVFSNALVIVTVINSNPFLQLLSINKKRQQGCLFLLSFKNIF